MANLVVNKLSEFLSKIIKNYSKEQLDVKLLKGEIELRDFEVDVNVINIYVEHYVPFLNITKAKVSDVKVGLPDLFHITGKPTIITIGHVEVECIQRDFSKPSAKELVDDKEGFFLTPDASQPETDDKELNPIQISIQYIQPHISYLMCALPTH